MHLMEPARWKSLANEARRAHGAVRKPARPHNLRLDGLEAVDLTVDLTSAPCCVHGSSDGCDVFRESVRVPDHWTELGVLGFFEPLA